MYWKLSWLPFLKIYDCLPGIMHMSVISDCMVDSWLDSDSGLLWLLLILSLSESSISGATYPLMGSHCMYKVFSSCIRAHWVRIPVTAFNRDCGCSVCEYLQTLHNWLLPYIIVGIAGTLPMSPSNRSRYPACSRESDCQTSWILIQTGATIQPAASGLAKQGPRPVPSNLGVFRCLARLIGCNPRFWFSGCSINCRIHISYSWSQKNIFRTSLSF